jgi:hypothetical protein
MVLEYWINGLISGPATHTTYSVGNAILALWRAGPETAAAALSNKVFETLGREASGITPGAALRPAQRHPRRHRRRMGSRQDRPHFDAAGRTREHDGQAG